MFLTENYREKKATKVVQDMLVQVRDIQAVVSTMFRRTKAPKIGAKLGDISPAIVCLKSLLETKVILHN